MFKLLTDLRFLIPLTKFDLTLSNRPIILFSKEAKAKQKFSIFPSL